MQAFALAAPTVAGSDDIDDSPFGWLPVERSDKKRCSRIHSNIFSFPFS
jgi:hypothetical protein